MREASEAFEAPFDGRGIYHIRYQILDKSGSFLPVIVVHNGPLSGTPFEGSLQGKRPVLPSELGSHSFVSIRTDCQVRAPLIIRRSAIEVASHDKGSTIKSSFNGRQRAEYRNLQEPVAS